MSVLLSTLGESPAVVTEAIDKLLAEGVEIKYVDLLTTKDSEAQAAMEFLYAHIPRYYGEKIQFINLVGPKRINAFQDIDNDDAIVEFLEGACLALQNCLKNRWKAYVSIAGGRKTMSALLTLAVQFYGATSLFHIVVDDQKIEEMGKISKLRNLPEEEQNRYLHPPPEKIKLIPLPFIGLFPMLDRIVSCLKGKADPEIESLLEQNNLLQKGKPTGLGRKILGILEKVKSAPKPRSGDCEVKIKKDEPKETEATRKYMNCLRSLIFVKKIESIGWAPGKPRVEQEPPNKLKVYLPGERISANIGLLLTTTAESKGELDYAEDLTKRFLKERRLLT